MSRCKHCDSHLHSSFYCFRKPRKPISQRGERAIEYEKWRDTVAKPYLDKKFGHVCSVLGCNATQVDVDHIKNRGSNPHLKMKLDNVQYLCRAHHREKTDHE